MARRKRGWLETLKGIGALAFLSLPLVAIGYAAKHERDRREAILIHGELAMAEVIASRRVIRSCRFKYAFDYEGTRFEGGDGGCPLVDRHPIGSEVAVRFMPRDPENSVAEGANLWPGWVMIPILIGPCLLLLVCIVAFAALKSGRRRR